MISVTCYLDIWLPNAKKKQRKEGIKSMMKFIFNRQRTLIFSYNNFTPSVSIYLFIFIFIKKLQTRWYSLRKVKQSCDVQGVPKVCSSNFMHYNFWSKLYFYMKLLEDVYFSIKNMYSEFQLLACPFCFFITFSSRWGMNWDTACRPKDDPFLAFLSPGAQDPVQPPNKICLV